MKRKREWFFSMEFWILKISLGSRDVIEPPAAQTAPLPENATVLQDMIDELRDNKSVPTKHNLKVGS